MIRIHTLLDVEKALNRMNRRICCNTSSGGGSDAVLTCDDVNACVAPAVTIINNEITNINNEINNIENDITNINNEITNLTEEVVTIENILNNFITNVANGTFLVDGGQVVWLQNYDYRVSAADYEILGNPYHANETPITLDPADGTFDRIDLVVADTSGVISVITGTPAASPQEPSWDPQTQIPLTFITVQAGTTAPACNPIVSVYAENLGVGGGEWGAASSSGTIVVNSTTNPRTGTKNIQATAAANNATLTFTPGAPVNFDNITQLEFYVRSKGTWAGNNLNNSKRLAISIYTSAGQVGNTVLLRPSGTFGFDSSITASYQQVAIPKLTFNVPTGSMVTSIKMVVTGPQGTMGFYMDDIALQDNCNFTPPPPTPGTGVTADNGLTMSTVTNVQFGSTTNTGSPLLHDTWLNTNTFQLQIQGNYNTGTSSINAPVMISNSSTNSVTSALIANGYTGIRAFATSGIGVYGQSSGTALYGFSFGSYGMRAEAAGTAILGQGGTIGTITQGPLPLRAERQETNNASTSVFTLIDVFGNTNSVSTVPANGFGSSIDFNTVTDNSGVIANRLANQIISKWTVAADATRTSQLIITGINSTTAGDIAYFNGNGMVGIGSSTASATRLNIVDNALGGATGVAISSTSTAAASNLQKLFSISLSGANATSFQTTYGAYVTNSHSGTGSQNYAGYFEASGGAFLNAGVHGRGIGAAGIGVWAFANGGGTGLVVQTESATAGTITGIQLTTSNTGSLTTAIGASFTATGATNNYALLTSGYTGMQTNTPTSYLHVLGSFATRVTSQATTINLSEVQFTQLIDATAANRTVNLPAASGCNGRIYVIKKIDSSGNTVTIDGNASETIDGATTVVLSTQYSGKMIQSDGSNWWIISSF